MIEVYLEQGSKDWLDWRRTKRMASETPAVMGLSPYQTPASIRSIKQGIGRTFVNDAMRTGTEQEKYAREAYQEATNELMRPAVFELDEYGCSVDGINLDCNLLVEIKTPKDGQNSDRWKLASQMKTTSYDYAQCQHQLMVTEATVCDFMVWDYINKKFLVVPIYPDKVFQQKIMTEWDLFSLTLGLRNDDEWLALSQKYKATYSQYNALSKELEAIKEKIKSLMTSNSNEGAGIKALRYAVGGSVDWQKVKADKELTDEYLEAFKKPSTEGFKITLTKE